MSARRPQRRPVTGRASDAARNWRRVWPRWIRHGRLARSAALIMEEDHLAGRKISELAAMLGITDRHLRRVFFAEYGVSPVQYLQTRRLLLAKSLLSDTHLTVTDVAMAAGFGSIRRFNDLFKTHYRLTPNRLRKQDQREGNDHGITLSLGYRPPYAWDSLISFLAVRAIPGVESVVEGSLPPHRGYKERRNDPLRVDLGGKPAEAECSFRDPGDNVITGFVPGTGEDQASIRCKLQPR